MPRDSIFKVLARLPWLLWFFGLATTGLILFNLNSRILIHDQDQIEPLTAALFLYLLISTFHMFVLHRNAWTVMIFGWVAVLVLISYKDYTTMDQLTMFHMIELPLILCCIALSIFYFKHPYINVRSNLIGPADRFYLSLPTVFTIQDTRFETQITTLSVTGFAIKRVNIPTLGADREAWISIPGIDGFQSKVRTVMETPDAVMLEIQGFTPSSVVEHLKIRKYVSELKKAADEAAAAKASTGAAV